MRAAPLALAALLLIPACGAGPTTEPDAAPTTTTRPATSTSTTQTQQATAPWPETFGEVTRRWTVRIVDRLPHDPTAFTQGLELLDGTIIEGTGRRGESELRRLDADTGEVLDRVALPAELFGEGLTVSGNQIVQLTWQAGRALRYDATTLEPVGEITYTGEGWGACNGDTGFWTSDGTATLVRRDPQTFTPLETVEVTIDDEPVERLNELECIGEHVVANVWKSDTILVIDPASGRVSATIDASALRTEVAPTDEQAVLNGIADLGDGRLMLTGKLWPTSFLVEVTPLPYGERIGSTTSSPPPTYGLDIETDTAVDGLDPAVAAVVAIAVTGDDLEVVLDGEEAAIIAELDTILAGLPPGVLVTWNGGGFDLPFLHDRATRLGLPLGLRLRLDPGIAGHHEPLAGHPGAYRARWHHHAHLDGYQLFRADVGATLRLPCGLKPLARLVGLPVVEVDRTRIHELSQAERRAYVASDAHLARALVVRRAQWLTAVDQLPDDASSGS